MISVILGILKIICLILLGILGVILLLILAVLLVPIRFEVCGSLQDKKPAGRAVVSWLLHILSFHVLYEDQLDISVRVFGFRIGQHETGQDTEDDEDREQKKKNKQKKEKRHHKQEKEDRPGKAEESEKERESGKVQEPDKVRESGKIQDPGKVQESEKVQEPEAPGCDGHTPGRKTVFPFRRICDKLRAGVRKIREKLYAVRMKLLGLKEKKEQVQAFFQDDANRATIKLAKRQVIRLIRHVLPRKMSGRVRFGFDDPYTTGQILTYVSPFYGWYAGKVELIPVFEEAVLEGALKVRGRIRIGTVLAIAVRMLYDKNFRRILKKLWKA